MTRPAGIPNKNKRGLLAELKRQYGKDFHPIMTMAKNCYELQAAVEGKKGEEREAALKTANAEWSRIAEYTEPKLKAIEIDVGARLERHILAERQMSEEEFERKYPVDAPEGTAADTD